MFVDISRGPFHSPLTDAIPSCHAQRSRHSSSNRAGSAHSDIFQESALVQSVRRIPRKRLSTSRTVENRRTGPRNFRLTTATWERRGEGAGPLLIAYFLVGTDTSSGAIHATEVPDSKKMETPYVVAEWVRDLGYERSCSSVEAGRSGKRMSS